MYDKGTIVCLFPLRDRERVQTLFSYNNNTRRNPNLIHLHCTKAEKAEQGQAPALTPSFSTQHISSQPYHNDQPTKDDKM